MDPPAFDDLPAVDDLVENGSVAKDVLGLPIRNFTFLPRYISIRPPGWLLEYWMRTDPRLTYRDIKARMTAPVAEKPRDNTLNMRREREARGPLALSCWTTRRGRIARVEVERVERWSPDMVSYNCTMEIEYSESTSEDPNSRPVQLRAKTLGGGDPAAAHGPAYPLDIFLDADHGHLHMPSERVAATIDLFYSLSHRARELEFRSWHFLPTEDLPPSWKPKAVFFYHSEINPPDASAYASSYASGHHLPLQPNNNGNAHDEAPIEQPSVVPTMYISDWQGQVTNTVGNGSGDAGNDNAGFSDKKIVEGYDDDAQVLPPPLGPTRGAQVSKKGNRNGRRKNGISKAGGSNSGTVVRRSSGRTSTSMTSAFLRTVLNVDEDHVETADDDQTVLEKEEEIANMDADFDAEMRVDVGTIH